MLKWFILALVSHGVSNSAIEESVDDLKKVGMSDEEIGRLKDALHPDKVKKRKVKDEDLHPEVKAMQEAQQDLDQKKGLLDGSIAPGDLKVRPVHNADDTMKRAAVDPNSLSPIERMNVSQKLEAGAELPKPDDVKEEAKDTDKESPKAKKHADASEEHEKAHHAKTHHAKEK